MSFKKEAVSGAKWTTVSTVIITICAILKLSILARFLDPSDFGLMALVTFVLGFITLFMDMGLTSAILFRQSISKKEYASLYWLNFAFSILLFILIWALSPAISIFYNEPRLNNLIPLAGLNIVFAGIGRQYQTIQEKKLKFKLVSLVETCGAVFSLVFAVILAVNDFGIYSLIYSAILQFAINNFLFLFFGIKSEGILFHFNYLETKGFLKIGIFKVGSQIVNYVNRDIDILIIGKIFGAEMLGGYSLAKQLVRRPLKIVDVIFIKISSSILPRYQQDVKKLKLHITNILKKLSVVDAFVYGIIALMAPLLVKIFYGEGYDNIIHIVRIFSAVVFLRSLGGQVAVLVIAKGRTDLEFAWNILTLLIYPVAIYIGSQFDLSGVVFAQLTTQLLLIAPLWFLFYYKLLHMNFVEYTKALIPFGICVAIFLIHFVILPDEIVFQTISSIVLSLCLFSFSYYTDSDFKVFIQKFQIN